MTVADMIVINGVRYRPETAIRLGLVAPVGRFAAALAGPPAPVTTTETPASDEEPVITTVLERPSKSGTKADWVAFALANGKTAEDIAGLKRDDIAALFPAE